MSWRFLPCWILLAAVSGCVDNNPAPGPPPIEFSFRKSQIPLKGMVMGIQNTSDTDLEVVTISVRSPKDEGARSHVIETRIVPKDSITVGWVELDGWKLKPGDEVTVECTGYNAPKKVTVPKP